MLHGTADKVTPFYNGMLLYNRAQDQNLPSTMIRMEGGLHVDFDDILTNYIDDLTTDLYDLITSGSEGPGGC